MAVQRQLGDVAFDDVTDLVCFYMVAIDKHIGIKFWSPQRIRGCVQCVFLWSVLVDPGPTRLLVTTHRGRAIAKKS